MTSGHRVIVVDGVPETAEVLRQVFGPRGHDVERVRGFDLTRQSADAATLFVVHDDGARESLRRSRYGTAPRVVIASLTEDVDSHSADERRLTQPFHYAELVRAVETLLAGQTAERSAA